MRTDKRSAPWYVENLSVRAVAVELCSSLTTLTLNCVSPTSHLVSFFFLKNPNNQTLTFPQEIWLGGGVAANIELRQKIRKLAKQFNLKLKTPYKKSLCGDNAAMIGITAFFQFQQNRIVTDLKQLDRQPRLNF